MRKTSQIFRISGKFVEVINILHHKSSPLPPAFSNLRDEETNSKATKILQVHGTSIYYLLLTMNFWTSNCGRRTQCIIFTDTRLFHIIAHIEQQKILELYLKSSLRNNFARKIKISKKRHHDMTAEKKAHTSKNEPIKCEKIY